jgi:hypothetical protein
MVNAECGEAKSRRQKALSAISRQPSAISQMQRFGFFRLTADS